MSEATYPVMIDPQPFASKPRNCGAITARIKKSEPVSVTAIELAQAIAKGQTWVAAAFRGGIAEDNFISQTLFAIDVDNAIEEIVSVDGKTEKTKRILYVGDDGFLDVPDAIERVQEAFDMWPLLVYRSFTASKAKRPHERAEAGEVVKYRIVIPSDEPMTSWDEAKQTLHDLLDLYPEADRACGGPNTRYYGTDKGVTVFGSGGGYVGL